MRAATSIDDLRVALEVEKRDQPNIIPYKFAILENYPGHIVLCYIPRQNLVREFIKVKANGYWFHQKFQTSVQALISYFKANFKDSEYRKHHKRQKSPRILTQEEIAQKKREEAKQREGADRFTQGFFQNSNQMDNSPRTEFGGRGRGRGADFHNRQQPGNFSREFQDQEQGGRGRGRGRGRDREDNQDFGGGYKRQKTEPGFKHEDSDGGQGW